MILSMASDCKTKKWPRQMLMTRPWTIFILLACVLVFGFIWIMAFVSPYKFQHDPLVDHIPHVLSFEDPSELDYFTCPRTSNLTTSSKHYKDGFHSMLWRWQPGDELKLKLRERFVGKLAGIVFWIYRNEASDGNLTVSLRNSVSLGGNTVALRFNVSLKFTGWRAAWVALHETNSCLKKPCFDEIIFSSPVEEISSQMIFMDLLCFMDHVKMESRDKIIPPINGSIYTIKATWQQTYRWSLVIPPEVNGTTPLSEKEKQQMDDLYLIEKRLVNWFANDSISPAQFRGNVLKRWESLVVTNFQIARFYLKRLNISVSHDGVITGSPLFQKRSQFGHPVEENTTTDRNIKLGSVTFHIMLPLTLEYYFSSKNYTILDTVRRELANVNSMARRKLAVKRITSYDLEYSEFLLSELGNFKTPLTRLHFRNCLRKLNQKKLDTILLLLEYITDQGWTEGSAMGSLDHAMNKVGNGFMNSMFLLRKQLAKAGKLDKILRTMRWYNNFGEIYQENFEFSGATADRLRSFIVYRLEIVLMSPERTVHEIRAKLRDMAAYVRSCNNALLSHPAFLAMFKPDLSCFHHLGVYGQAYTPDALTVSSMIWYLLQGTSFSLNANSKFNLREGLLSYGRIAVKYSLPNSICGRFPNYFRAKLIYMLPGYAFFSVRPQNMSNTGRLQKVSLGNDTEMIRLFLRLYDPQNLKVLGYLRSSGIYEQRDYTPSIGSLQILQTLHKEAKIARIQPSEPERGHWVQNFAALSIHRRKHWVVTMKGFSRYIWDFEQAAGQNVYGLYQSHGALQISNSEESLQSYDVQHGWDWTRVPGTTTIELSLKEMIVSGSYNRFYQPSKLVGGVVLTSKCPSSANGVFGMRFHRPLYGWRHADQDGHESDEKTKNICRPEASKQPTSNMRESDDASYECSYTKQRTKFNFRKSVFFYNSLIVCLGSNINAVNSEPRRTQTTLFQDKCTSSSSVIFINGKLQSLWKNFAQVLNDSAAILDSNENGYYIPKDMSANVVIRRQHSKKPDGKTRSYARYATVWLDHGINPVSASYEYAILVATNVANIEALRKAQSSDSPLYKVVHKSSRAHVVRFAGNTAGPSVTYGYVFYDPENLHLIEGPVESVSAECLVMAQIDFPNFSNMNLSLSSPDLNYNTTKKLRDSSDNGINEYFYMRSQPVNITVYLTRSVVSQRVLVNGKAVPESAFNHYVTVKPGDPQRPISGGREIVFKNLINGESVEVHLTAVEKDFAL